MTSTKWKLGAKIVAYFDLIASILSLILIGVVVILLAIKAVHSDGELGKYIILANPVFRMVIAISVVYVGVFLWTSIQLLHAVNQKTETAVALRKAKFWRNVHIVTITIETVVAFGALALTSLLAVILRGIFLLIVCKFIGTLKVERSIALKPRVEYAVNMNNDVESSTQQLMF